MADFFRKEYTEHKGLDTKPDKRRDAENAKAQPESINHGPAFIRFRRGKLDTEFEQQRNQGTKV
jgi:hypothetical protein